MAIVIAADVVVAIITVKATDVTVTKAIAISISRERVPKANQAFSNCI